MNNLSAKSKELLKEWMFDGEKDFGRGMARAWENFTGILFTPSRAAHVGRDLINSLRDPEPSIIAICEMKIRPRNMWDRELPGWYEHMSYLHGES